MIRKVPQGETVVGVDPGKTGAIVVLDAKGKLVAQTRMPLIRGTRDIDHRRIYDFVRDARPRLIAQEYVRSRPENGVKQAFEFGRTIEACRCVAAVLSVPFREVMPKKWQSLVVGLDHGDVKASVVAAALIRWPGLSLKFKVDWDRADAAFIALFAATNN